MLKSTLDSSIHLCQIYHPHIHPQIWSFKRNTPSIFNPPNCLARGDMELWKKEKKREREKKKKKKRRRREKIAPCAQMLKRGSIKIRSFFWKPCLSASTIILHSTLIRMIGITIFARTNFWLSNMHDMGKPSLFLPWAPHRPLVIGKSLATSWWGFKYHLSESRVPFEELSALISKFSKTFEYETWKEIEWVTLYQDCSISQPPKTRWEGQKPHRYG